MAMTLRLSDDDDRALQALADEQNISKHEAVVRAIRVAVGEHRELRAAILKRIVDEDRALLDLLAK